MIILIENISEENLYLLYHRTKNDKNHSIIIRVNVQNKVLVRRKHRDNNFFACHIARTTLRARVYVIRTCDILS